MAIVGFPPHEYPREKREKDRLGRIKEMASSFQRGVEKARVWPQGRRTLDRILWSAIIGGVGPRVSGKANFLAARELPSAHKTRIYRVAATVMARHSMH